MKSFLHKIIQLYTFFRLLSLDIVLGAVCSAYFASRVFTTSPSIYFWITLIIAVWVIYSLDHIMDGKRIMEKSENILQTYHYKHRILLIVIIIPLSVLSAILVLFFLEKEIILFGLSTFLFVLIYLILNSFFQKRKAYFPKEFIIAILYTWGIFGGFIFMKGEINLTQELILGNFLLLAFANVLLFSLFDIEKDKVNQFNSFALQFGITATNKLLQIILGISFLLTIFIGIQSSAWIVPMIVLLMNVVLLFLTFTYNSSKQNSYGGLIADTIFYIPVLIALV